ncbi:YcbK family protein [Sulfitobacter aestuarii]|uniref:Murein endopeptidase K n=1 Tax=Sulfitobacter aestuarii TaxID=2161676 RepID=A0ABW5U1V5_9RHOB
MISRRHFISATSAAAALAGLAPGVAANPSPNPDPSRADTRLDRLVNRIDPTIALWNPHTDERLQLRFFGAAGYDREALRKINWLLRDWRENEMAEIDARLLWALAALRQAGMQEGNAGLIHAHSGYRTLKTNEYLRRKGYRTARHSFHLRARAVDFTMPGAPVASLARYAQWLQIGGTGHYRNNFVHIDSGGSRRWTG